MHDNEKITVGIVLSLLLIFSMLTVAGRFYQLGFENGVSSVDQRVPSFEITVAGGYVNESVYNETYYQAYPFADKYPLPVVYNDSFIIGISIFGYYENTTQREKANFGVRFSDEILDLTNIKIDKICTDSEREQGSVGLYFSLEGFTAITACAYGRMSIVMFGYGSVPSCSTIFGFGMLTLQEWEGDV